MDLFQIITKTLNLTSLAKLSTFIAPSFLLTHATYSVLVTSTMCPSICELIRLKATQTALANQFFHTKFRVPSVISPKQLDRKKVRNLNFTGV